MVKIIRASGAWIWMIVLFVLSSIPSNDLPEVGFYLSDKLAHLIVYFILGVLLGWRIKRGRVDSKGLCWRNSFFIGIFYAIFDEVHQIFVPGRQFDIWDITFDIIGIFLGIVFIKNRMLKKQAENDGVVQ